MAEIRIQEKKNPIWPWILLIVILIIAAILLYLYLDRNNDMYEEDGIVPPDTTTYYERDTLGLGGGMEPSDEVEQFRAFTTQDTMGAFSKEYVINGLNMMSGAVYSVVQSTDTAQNDMMILTDSLVSYTTNLTDTASRNFSRDVGRSLTAAYNIISTIQKNKYPELTSEVNELRTSLRNFDSSKPVERQEKPIRNFFRVSGSVLSDMNGNTQVI
jgi:hypothetical protein